MPADFIKPHSKRQDGSDSSIRTECLSLKPGPLLLGVVVDGLREVCVVAVQVAKHEAGPRQSGEECAKMRANDWCTWTGQQPLRAAQVGKVIVDGKECRSIWRGIQLGQMLRDPRSRLEQWSS